MFVTVAHQRSIIALNSDKWFLENQSNAQEFFESHPDLSKYSFSEKKSILMTPVKPIEDFANY